MLHAVHFSSRGRGWREMHDYIRGAYEALSWVRALIRDQNGPSEALEKVLGEVEGALEDISKGAATDFRRKLRQ